MGRNLIVIKSLTFKRYYSNSCKLNNNNNNNINNKNNDNINKNNHNPASEGINFNISNPLDKNKNMIVYIDMESNKKNILEENKGKPGIYMITNKKTKDFYIGQSKNLYNRFLNYFNPAYLKRFPNSIIGRAVIKYGYSNFSLTILEYCDKANLTAREQYHPFGVDTLNPVSSILHTATDLQSSYFKKSIINISSWRSSLELLSCRETVRAKVPDGLLGNKLIIRSYSEAEAPQTCSSLLDP